MNKRETETSLVILSGIFLFILSVSIRPSLGSSYSPPDVRLLSPSVTGLQVSINGVTNATTGGATVTEIRWSWGDGTQSIGWFPQTHTYEQPGRYMVTVTSVDSNGLEGSATTTVIVSQSHNPSATGKTWDARAVARWIPPYGTCDQDRFGVGMLSLSCAVGYMEEHHDSAQSVSFAKEHDAILQSFKPMGRVDLGTIIIPLPQDHGGRGVEWVVLNSQPALLYPGNSKVKLESRPLYSTIYHYYDNSQHGFIESVQGTTFEKMKERPDRGQEFIFQTHLMNAECCPSPYSVRTEDEFSPDGTHIGIRVLDPCYNPEYGKGIPNFHVPICKELEAIQGRTSVRKGKAETWISAGVPMLSCPAVQQGRYVPPMTPNASYTTAYVPSGGAGIFSLYDPGDRILAPRGWKCGIPWISSGETMLLVSPDIRLTGQSRGGPGPGLISASPPEVAFDWAEPATGPGIQAICGAGSRLFTNLDESCKQDYRSRWGGDPQFVASPPWQGEQVTRINSRTVKFYDPPFVKGTGKDSGGKYPVLGIVLALPFKDPSGRSDSLPSLEILSCAMPSSKMSLCRPILNYFLRNHPK